MRKTPGALHPLDVQLRTLLPVTQSSGVQVRIDKVVGFELFNTTKFHNHETWSDGYRVIGPVEAAWTPWAAFQQAALDLGLEPRDVQALWDIASGARQGLVVYEAEDLDDAVNGWAGRRGAVAMVLGESPALPNQRTRLALLGYHTREEGDSL